MPPTPDSTLGSRIDSRRSGPRAARKPPPDPLRAQGPKHSEIRAGPEHHYDPQPSTLVAGTSENDSGRGCEAELS
eukprot:8953497-Pyramimonas_sp.AAC.1